MGLELVALVDGGQGIVEVDVLGVDVLDVVLDMVRVDRRVQRHEAIHGLIRHPGAAGPFAHRLFIEVGITGRAVRAAGAAGDGEQ